MRIVNNFFIFIFIYYFYNSFGSSVEKKKIDWLVIFVPVMISSSVSYQVFNILSKRGVMSKFSKKDENLFFNDTIFDGVFPFSWGYYFFNKTNRLQNNLYAGLFNGIFNKKRQFYRALDELDRGVLDGLVFDERLKSKGKFSISRRVSREDYRLELKKSYYLQQVKGFECKNAAHFDIGCGGEDQGALFLSVEVIDKVLCEEIVKEQDAYLEVFLERIFLNCDDKVFYFVKSFGTGQWYQAQFYEINFIKMVLDLLMGTGLLEIVGIVLLIYRKKNKL